MIEWINQNSDSGIMEAKVWVPSGLPCVSSLDVAEYNLSDWKSCTATPKVLFLNLMPEKEVTEMDIVRTLSHCGVTCQVIPVKIRGQKYKTTSQSHMETFYLDFEEFESDYFERMIITGAPLEQMPFEEVRYWKQLQHIMHWADKHVRSTLYICWGAQAGLYEHYSVPKYPLNDKMFGIFYQQVIKPASPLMQNLSPSFFMPNSRHTEVRKADILSKEEDGLQLLALSEESGVGVMADSTCRRVFIVGHLEYNANTLDNEYKRDLSKHLPIKAPRHYYDKNGKPMFQWRNDAITFYRNWMTLN